MDYISNSGLALELASTNKSTAETAPTPGLDIEAETAPVAEDVPAARGRASAAPLPEFSPFDAPEAELAKPEEVTVAAPPVEVAVPEAVAPRLEAADLSKEDMVEAGRFLELLGRTGEATVIWSTFPPEGPGMRHFPSHGPDKRKVAWASITDRLKAQPNHGMGAVLMPPKPQPADWGSRPEHLHWSGGPAKTWGTKNDHISHSIALFGECDVAGLADQDQLAIFEEAVGRKPSLVVKTGGKSLHQYLVLEPGEELDLAWHKRGQKALAAGMQRALVARLGAGAAGEVDKSLSNPARVMRLPGSVHPGTGVRATLLVDDGPKYGAAELQELIVRLEAETGTRPRRDRRPAAGGAGAAPGPLSIVAGLEEYSEARRYEEPLEWRVAKARAALACLKAADLDYGGESATEASWLGVGMALHATVGDAEEEASEALLEAWDEWSATDADRYEDGGCQVKWESFTRSPGGLGLGSLLAWAKAAGGYVDPSPQLLGEAQAALQAFIEGAPSEGAIREAISAQLLEKELRWTDEGAEQAVRGLFEQIAWHFCADSAEAKVTDCYPLRDEIKSATGAQASWLNDRLKPALKAAKERRQGLETAVKDLEKAVKRLEAKKQREEAQAELAASAGRLTGVPALVAALGDGWQPPARGQNAPQASCLPVGEMADTLAVTMGDRLGFDERLMLATLDEEPLEPDDVQLMHVDLSSNGWLIGKEMVVDALCHAARRRKFHPIKSYLNRVADDAEVEPIDLDRFGASYFGVEDPLQGEFLRVMLLAAVHRAFNPGVPFKNCVVLVGRQTMFKSLSLNALCGSDWFIDTPFTGKKDDLLAAHQSWFYELAELESITTRKEAGELKAVLSTTVDRIRPPYGRVVQDHPRGFIFVGSSNRRDFLVDDTGNDRFWIVDIDQILDYEKIARDRDRIWKAAVLAVWAGEHPYLSRELMASSEERNEGFRAEQMWTNHIGEWARPGESRCCDGVGMPAPVLDNEGWRTGFSTPEALYGSRVLNRDSPTGPHHARQGAAALRALGYEQTKNPVHRGGRKQRVWVRIGG